MSEKLREEIISKALDSPEGKSALAAAMIEPIKSALTLPKIASSLLRSTPEEIIDLITVIYRVLAEPMYDYSKYEFAPVHYYLQENYDKIYHLGLGDFYLGKQDFISHIAYLHKVNELEKFLGKYYEDCVRIYKLSKLYSVD